MKETPDDNGQVSIKIDARDKHRLDEYRRLTCRGLKHSITRLLDLAEQHDLEYQAAKARQSDAAA